MDNIVTVTPPSRYEQVEGWIGSAFTKLHIDDLLEKLHLSKEVVIETSIFFVIGTVLGFLAKRYLRQLIIALVILFIVVKVMEFVNVGTMIVNWDHLKELTGVAPSDSVNTVASSYATWLKSHIHQTVAAVVGILIGSKIG